MHVIGQGIATLLAVAATLVLTSVVLVGDFVAIAGCAICDNSPPNYFAAVGLTALGGGAQWAVVRGWRAACATGGYRR